MKRRGRALASDIFVLGISVMSMVSLFLQLAGDDSTSNLLALFVLGVIVGAWAEGEFGDDDEERET